MSNRVASRTSIDAYRIRMSASSGMSAMWSARSSGTAYVNTQDSYNNRGALPRPKHKASGRGRDSRGASHSGSGQNVLTGQRVRSRQGHQFPEPPSPAPNADSTVTTAEAKPSGRNTFEP